METAFKAQAEKVLNTMEVVQRDEFEAVREMALKARAENKKLQARIAELEEKLGMSASERAGDAPKAAAKPSPTKIIR